MSPIDERFEVPMARLSVKVYPAFDRDMETYLRTHPVQEDAADFEFSPGLVGKKVTLGWTPRYTQEWTVIDYALIPDRRAIQIHCECPHYTTPVLEGVFDQIARSVRLSKPLDNWPRPGTWKTFTGYGFSFEYPGDWVWLSPWYDDADVNSRPTKLMPIEWVEPRNDGYDWSEGNVPIITVMIAAGFTLEKYKQNTEKQAQKFGTPVWVRTPFTTTNGREGFRNRLNDPPSDGYVLPLADDKLLFLTCSCSRDLEPWESVFEPVARSLVVE